MWLPILGSEVWTTLVENMHLAGYQKGKGRATWQYPVMKGLFDSFPLVDDFYQDLISLLYLAGTTSVVNSFWNVNQGNVSKSHRDVFSIPATHRCLAYYVKNGADSILTITLNGEDFNVIVPSGSCLIVPQKVLAAPHKHATTTTNLAVILELFIPNEIANPFVETVQPAQPDLSFDAFEHAFKDPYASFKGSPSRYGSFSIPSQDQSITYLAISALLKSRGNREYGSKKDARARVLAMDNEKQRELASIRGTELAAAAHLHSLPVMNGDSISFDAALNQVRELDHEKQRELASIRGTELAAAAHLHALPVMNGDSITFISFNAALNQVRELDHEKQRELASIRMVELNSMDQNERLAKHDADHKRDADTISNWRRFWKLPEEGGRFHGHVLRRILKNEKVKLSSMLRVSVDAYKKKLEELEKSWRSTSALSL